MGLANLDLNLLVGFDALMQERSVTRAARRMGLSQSAMSNVLRRIRDTLADEVLVRRGHVMVPTPRALELEGPIRDSLRAIQEALAPPPAFEPAESDHVFWFGGRDYMEAVVMPSLACRIAARAPKVNLRVRNIRAEPVVAELQRGRFDLAIGFFPGLHDHVRHEVLFHDPHAVIARPDHPLVRGGALSIDTYLSAHHLLVSPFGGEVGMVDSVLGRAGASRRIALTVANFAVAPLVVAATDLLCTLPRRIAHQFVAAGAPLQCVPSPVELVPAAISMVWHERSHDSPPQRWVRDQLRACAEEWSAEA